MAQMVLSGSVKELAQVSDLLEENRRLRDALEPFSRLALTRAAKKADDFDPVTTIMAHCRAAQRAMSD